ncbi:DOMON-like domain-containing protein [Novosphingobium flavum]|uniref:DOMON-like domain-containing protein n=1 Tax=Novosphingobium flavum TaxID=1778672 RepID=A0A7X1KKX0_9SPHN|nr:DOMON-like domain-containing protein [Novosphingobium flavum]MBC2664723.1 DOMON-like domain-containing protein [Novosphingobium flavum]
MPHPDSPPLAVTGIEAAVIGLDAHWLRVRWRIEGSARLLVPPFAGKGRTDGLWQQTCFELFIKTPDEDGYVELNLSPSERWAAYDFATYRAGMENRDMPRDPDCTMRLGGNMAIFDAAIPVAALPPLPWKLGISAVIEELGEDEDAQAGEEASPVKSLWALRHAPGQPDFHSPACFAASLAAPERA